MTIHVLLIALALSPVMYQTFFLDFEENDIDPIMKENQYRWIYSMIAIAAVPGAIVSPWCYKKIGVAVSCVCSNLLTACVISALTLVATMNPVTKGNFALYVTILYIGFSLAIVSMLSTGPMLDRISPKDKKGTIQGLNATIYDGVGAVFPFVFGLIADSNGNSYVSWVCVGISIITALVNLPLAFNPRIRKKDIYKDDGVTVPASMEA